MLAKFSSYTLGPSCAVSLGTNNEFGKYVIEKVKKRANGRKVRETVLASLTLRHSVGQASLEVLLCLGLQKAEGESKDCGMVPRQRVTPELTPC